MSPRKKRVDRIRAERRIICCRGLTSNSDDTLIETQDETKLERERALQTLRTAVERLFLRSSGLRVLGMFVSQDGVEDSEQLSGRNYACDELGASYEMEIGRPTNKKNCKSLSVLED